MPLSPDSGLRQTLEIAQRKLFAGALAAALAAVSCGSPSPMPITGSWTMYRGDLARDGHPAGATLDAAHAARLAVLWRGHLDGAIDGTPAVAKGKGIAGTACGTLAAFDVATRATIWSQPGLRAIATSPSISRDPLVAT